MNNLKSAWAFLFLFFLHGFSIRNGQQGISYNGSVLAEVGDLEHESVKLPQKHHRSRNVDDTTNAPILANTCYQQPFFQSNY